MKNTKLQGWHTHLSATPKYAFLLCAMFCLFIGSRQAHAQSSCLTNTLIINTGYDPNTGAAISLGGNDPKWTVTNLSPLCAAMTSSPVPFSAITIPDSGLWVPNNPPGIPGGWISFLPTQGYWTDGSQPLTAYTETLRRCFNMCSNDKIIVALNIADDNYISNLNIDGGASLFSQPATPTNINDQAYQSFSTTIPVTSGQHCLNITVVNYPVTEYNPTGLNVNGIVKSASGTNSIISESAECANYECPKVSPCSDTCFWKVYGNNIINGNNTFGTNTDDDINYVTNSTPRGIFTKDALFGLYGQNAASAPTAYLDVECLNHNVDGSGLSDIRFRDLEHFQEGNLVIIDPKMGYIFNSGVNLQSLNTAMTQVAELQNNNNVLQSQISELKAKLDELAVNTAGGVQNIAPANILYQNTPNPFTKETSIGYYIVQISNTASLMIADMNGRKLAEYPISQSGKGNTVVTTGNMVPGMYLYTLIVDGVAIDTKKMVIAGQ